MVADDSISLQTPRPDEIVHHLLTLLARREDQTRIRKAARIAAGRFTWSAVLNRTLVPLLREVGATMPVPERRPGAQLNGTPESPLPATQDATSLLVPAYLLAAVATEGVVSASA